MLREMTTRQWLEWEAFMELEPFTFNREARADMRSAQIAQVIANVHRGEKRRPYELKDFLLTFDNPEPPKKKTWQEMQKIAYMIVDAYNAPGVTS